MPTTATWDMVVAFKDSWDAAVTKDTLAIHCALQAALIASKAAPSLMECRDCDFSENGAGACPMHDHHSSKKPAYPTSGDGQCDFVARCAHVKGHGVPHGASAFFFRPPSGEEQGNHLRLLAEAYQFIGALAAHANVFESPQVQNALDVLDAVQRPEDAEKTKGSILPATWPPSAPSGAPASGDGRPNFEPCDTCGQTEWFTWTTWIGGPKRVTCSPCFHRSPTKQPSAPASEAPTLERLKLMCGRLPTLSEWARETDLAELLHILIADFERRVEREKR